MSYGASARRSLCACAAASALIGAVPAVASAAVTTGSGGAGLVSQIVAAVASSATASCAAPALTQPFAAFGDSNSYALLAGESIDSLAGTGWTLAGGAKVVKSTLLDGTTGSVLDIPSGALAISPPLCVTAAYPTARAIVRSVAGSSGISAYVGYLSASPTLVATGSIVGTKAWTLSPALRINPSPVTGWQLAWFAFVGTGSGSENQLYDFYVDPRMKG